MHRPRMLDQKDARKTSSFLVDAQTMFTPLLLVRFFFLKKIRKRSIFYKNENWFVLIGQIHSLRLST